MEGIDHLLFLTDVAFIPYPTLEDKVHIINNTLEITKAWRHRMSESSSPRRCGSSQSEDARHRGSGGTHPHEQRRGDHRLYRGRPLSLDLAIDAEAAKHKGATDRPIQGDADILLFPDIHAGNLVYKAMVHTANLKNGNILTGTKAPVILTSRSDSMEVKVNSLALGAVVAEYLK